MNRALPFVSAVALAAALAAGPIAATAAGQVGPGPGLGPTETAVTGVVAHAFHPQAGDAALCVQPDYTLEGLDGLLYLSSATIDLGLYVGQNVKLHGTRNFECPILEVQTVEAPPPASLAICGTGGFGCPVRLVSGPSGLATHWLLASPAPNFLPLNPVKGSFLLAQPFVLVATAGSPSFGPGAVFDFTVPMIPALAGHTVWFQAARREVGINPPGTQPPLQFGNLVSLHVVGFVLVCDAPGC